MVSIQNAAPQLLVGDLEASVSFYEARLGFSTDFVYEGFYASVSRDGATIHLKCAAKLEADRVHRAEANHLDVHLDVSDVRGLGEELEGRAAPIRQPLTEQPWGRIDIHVVDPDGYILCFSEPSA